MPTAHLSNTDLFYTDDGAGNPLVFIHGLGATHGMFEPQIETFSRTHRVICPDTRGNGQSGRLTGPVSTVLDRQCDDLAELLDRLGIQRTVLCGVSYGGVFTFHFALRHPDRLAAMVVVDSFGDTRITSPGEALLQRLAINRAEHTSRLGQVRCPALGIVGDTSLGVRYMRRAMRAIPGARLEIVPDSFDPTNLCQPETFNRLLAGFLAEVGW